jgi:ribosomal protein L32
MHNGISPTELNFIASSHARRAMRLSAHDHEARATQQAPIPGSAVIPKRTEKHMPEISAFPNRKKPFLYANLHFTPVILVRF